MVSALDSRARGLGFSPVEGHCFVFLGMTLNSYSASFHPGLYMSLGTNKFNVGGNPANWTSITSRWSRNTPGLLHASETGISSGLMGHLARMQILPLPTKYTCMSSTLKYF